MAYITGTCTGHYELFEILRSFLKGVGTNTTPVYSGTGTGTLTGLTLYPATITETWTLTCTAGGPTGTFSVVGSVSGAQASATVGTLYTNSFLSFTINDGGTDFIIGDNWTIATTRGALSTAGTPWEELEYSSASNRLSWLKGPGLDNTKEIFVGLRTYQDVPNDYYNLSIFGATGWVSGNSYSTQPNFSGAYGIPCWNNSITYWIRANGQNFSFVAKIQNVFVMGYGGFCLPLGATPSQWPYPLMIGGMLTSEAATRYSDVSYVSFWKGNRSNLRLLFVDGVWKQPYAWPFHVTSTDWDVRNTNSDQTVAVGYYRLNDIYLHDNSRTIYAVPEGLYQISGYDQAAENTCTISGVDYIAALDVWRTGATDYVAMRLD